MMTQAGKGRQIAPRSAAEVENGEGCLAAEMAQQRCDILAHVVLAGAGAKALGARFVMGERQGSDLFEIIGRWRH
jgi:hypothetical protein